MKLKKLTLAAVLVSMSLIAAGTNGGVAAENDIATLSTPAAQVKESGFKEVASVTDIPVVTGSACPIQTCQPACPCEPKCEPAPCEPCGSACPIADPCPCEPKCDACAPACDPCGPACPVTDPCPAKPEPVCAVCPNSSQGELQKGIQAYAYPASIYGSNTITDADPHSISLSESHGIMVSRDAGNLKFPTLTASGCGCNTVQSIAQSSGCGCVETGAAASLPCFRDPCAATDSINGISVSRDPLKFEGAQCPIQIKTKTSMDVMKKYYEEIKIPAAVTGAAAPLSNIFPDVPSEFWASCDINKLTEKSVIAGYPDRTFKPNIPVSRAEFASLIANGFCLEPIASCHKTMFSDVPAYNWASPSVEKAVDNGYLAGYPDNKFRPKSPVSRAEAMTTMAKAFKCEMSECDADSILKTYKDGCDVPGWAKMGVAKVLKQGVLTDSPDPTMIKPNNNASRADIAAMLAQARISLGIDSKQEVSAACPCSEQNAMVEKEEIVSIPTLNIKLEDQLTAKVNKVGDKFAARTVEPVTINGVNYPCDSVVYGEVVEVVRPNGKCEGALKIALTDIKNGDCKAKLPRQILSAQVQKQKKPNWFIRTVEMPFTFTGQVLGTVGRTVGGAVVSLGNAAEQVSSGTGIATGEMFQGKWKASGRSLRDATKALAMAPVDLGRTAVSGTAGLFHVTNDEVAYVVNPDGTKISSINPNEKITVAFGCQGK